MRYLALLSLIVLTACSSAPNWTKPGIPQDQVRADYAECRQYADSQISPADYVAPGDEHNANPMRMAERSDNRKRFNTFAGICMEEKGYRPLK